MSNYLIILCILYIFHKLNNNHNVSVVILVVKIAVICAKYGSHVCNILHYSSLMVVPTKKYRHVLLWVS